MVTRNHWLSLTLFTLVSCSSSAPAPKPHTDTAERVNRALEKIQIGATRAEVERVLGQPMNLSRDAQGTMAMYMFGMPDMQAMMRAAQPSRGASILSGAMGIAGSAAGMVAPGAGGALQMGTALIGEGAGLMNQATMEMPDMNSMRMINVRYEKDIVTEISQMNPGAMGGGPMGEGELETPEE